MGCCRLSRNVAGEIDRQITAAKKKTNKQRKTLALNMGQLLLLLATATIAAGSFAPPRPKFHFTPRFGCESRARSAARQPAAASPGTFSDSASRD